MRARCLSELCGLCLLSVLLFGGSARADDGENKAAAEALFDDARRLIAEKKYAEACPKLESSQRLDPGVGTMLNLADCYEKLGKTASAWAMFRETISAAHKASSLDREEIARSRARELEPKLAYLTIATWQGQNVSVQRDGTPVDAAVLGTELPVDPGDHVIVASAQGKRSWSTTVRIDPGPSKARVTVPILPDEVESGGGVPAPAAASLGATSTGTDRGPRSGSTQRVLAIVAGGVGVVGVALGSIFGLNASSDWSDAKSSCTSYPNGCTAHAKSLSDDARSEATVSTVAFVIGAAGLAGGVVLWLTAPDGREEPHAALKLGPGQVSLAGRF